MQDDPLVSIGLPVRNGAKTVEAVVRSVMAQDHGNLELIISDNASTDGTEELCRELARHDERVVYWRQPENIGLINNFLWAKARAKGTFFRWIGDDDALSPDCLSRCVEVFAADPRLIVVTTQLRYLDPDGTSWTTGYDRVALGEDDPVVRFDEMLRLLTEGFLLLDPVYALLRHAVVAGIPYRRMLNGDEAFAAKLALAGPWGHVPTVLGQRHLQLRPRPEVARVLGIPAWHLRVATLLQCRDLMDHVRCADLTDAQRHHARRAILRYYARRQRRTVVKRVRKVGTLALRRIGQGRPS